MRLVKISNYSRWPIYILWGSIQVLPSFPMFILVNGSIWVYARNVVNDKLFCYVHPSMYIPSALPHCKVHRFLKCPFNWKWMRSWGVLHENFCKVLILLKKRQAHLYFFNIFFLVIYYLEHAFWACSFFHKIWNIF